ncbi:MAG: copper(I)-binding protein, partial [Bermanella sp.]
FAPGGLHLMLIGLKQPLRENDQVLLQFFSDLNEEVSVTFPVISVINEHRHH